MCNRWLQDAEHNSNHRLLVRLVPFARLWDTLLIRAAQLVQEHAFLAGDAGYVAAAIQTGTRS
jgi:hypothetical protein